MNLAAAAQSSVGRKLISGLTGLILVGFVIGHLIGNLLLLVGPKEFNDYAYFLEHFGHGAGLLLAEAGLIVVLAFHAWTGYSVWATKWRARQTSYALPGDAGGVSKKSVSSTSMLWTGVLLLGFIIWHVAQFKFGIIDRTDRTVNVDGTEMRDLYGIVVDSFASPLWSGIYIVIMIVLGLHLWHGAWSAFQSMGLTNGRYLPVLTRISYVVATVLTIGFILLPLIIFVANDRFQQADQEYMRQYGTGQTSQTVIRYLSEAPMGLAERGA